MEIKFNLDDLFTISHYLGSKKDELLKYVTETKDCLKKVEDDNGIIRNYNLIINITEQEINKIDVVLNKINNYMFNIC